jgi:hypothetical protein
MSLEDLRDALLGEQRMLEDLASTLATLREAVAEQSHCDRAAIWRRVELSLFGTDPADGAHA